MKKIIANLSSREKRYAVLEQNEVMKIESMPPNQLSAVGNIYMGKVAKVLPGMDAVFVDYGAERHGFLHRDELPAFQLADKSLKGGTISQYIRQGEKLLVQVKRDETGNKGAKLSGLIELSSPSLVYIAGLDYVGVSKKFQQEDRQKYWRNLAFQHKNQDEGLIIRTSMENQSEESFVHILHALREQYNELHKQARALKHPGLVLQKDTFIELLLAEMDKGEQGEIILDDFNLYQELSKQASSSGGIWKISYEAGPKNIFFEHHLDIQLSKAMKKIVWLENGSYLIFEETEAFTVIDVNTGKFTGKMEKEETLFQTNLLAAKEAARQLRLRNIGGIVLIDFINMDSRQHQQEVMKLMKQETVKDDRRVKVIGFTELGILQLTRKRTSPSLYERTTVSCTVCGGSGKVLSPETVAFQLERELMEHRKTDDEAVWVEVNQAVADVLLGEKEIYRPILEEAIAKKLILSIISTPLNRYHIKRFGSYQEIYEASRLTY